MLDIALSRFGLTRKDLIRDNDFLSKAIRKRLALSYFCERHNLSDSQASEIFFAKIIAKEKCEIEKSN